jgi:hypothetical protein
MVLCVLCLPSCCCCVLQVPISILPGVFLGNAVAADSQHLLTYLGVTHIINAAQVSTAIPHLGLICDPADMQDVSAPQSCLLLSLAMS